MQYPMDGGYTGYMPQQNMMYPGGMGYYPTPSYPMNPMGMGYYPPMDPNMGMPYGQRVT